jgi:hypothetical protein
LNLFGLEVSEAIDRKEIVSKQKVEEVKAALRELGGRPPGTPNLLAPTAIDSNKLQLKENNELRKFFVGGKRVPGPGELP